VKPVDKVELLWKHKVLIGVR